jgi:bacterioferritin-associated ferredoxin
VADTEYDGAASEADAEKDRYLSTSYSSKITCGACGAPLKRVPVMYERMNIDWRCGKCLRRDKPVMEDRVG